MTTSSDATIAVISAGLVGGALFAMAGGSTSDLAGLAEVAGVQFGASYGASFAHKALGITPSILSQTAATAAVFDAINFFVLGNKDHNVEKITMSAAAEFVAGQVINFF